MDALFKQFERVFASQSTSFYWYLGAALIIVVLAVIFIVFKSKSGEFLEEVEKLKNLASSHNDMIKQNQERERELEDQIAKKDAQIAELERKLRQVEHHVEHKD